jgi:hypothetical protein
LLTIDRKDDLFRLFFPRVPLFGGRYVAKTHHYRVHETSVGSIPFEMDYAVRKHGSVVFGNIRATHGFIVKEASDHLPRHRRKTIASPPVAAEI